MNNDNQCSSVSTASDSCSKRRDTDDIGINSPRLQLFIEPPCTNDPIYARQGDYNNYYDTEPLYRF